MFALTFVQCQPRTFISPCWYLIVKKISYLTLPCDTAAWWQRVAKSKAMLGMITAKTTRTILPTHLQCLLRGWHWGWGVGTVEPPCPPKLPGCSNPRHLKHTRNMQEKVQNTNQSCSYTNPVGNIQLPASSLDHAKLACGKAQLLTVNTSET